MTYSTPRTRTPRAEIEKMSETERKSMKQRQNRVNSQRCLAKKNEEITNLSGWTKVLEEQFAIAKTVNWKQEERLLEIYSGSGENSFGELEEFHRKILFQKTSRALQVMQFSSQPISTLEQNLRDAEEKLKAVLEDRESVTATTFASRKSRARKQRELAELRLKAGRLQAKLDEELEVRKVLHEFLEQITDCKTIAFLENFD